MGGVRHRQRCDWSQPCRQPSSDRDGSDRAHPARPCSRRQLARAASTSHGGCPGRARQRGREHHDRRRRHGPARSSLQSRARDRPLPRSSASFWADRWRGRRSVLHARLRSRAAGDFKTPARLDGAGLARNRPRLRAATIVEPAGCAWSSPEPPSGRTAASSRTTSVRGSRRSCGSSSVKIGRMPSCRSRERRRLSASQARGIQGQPAPLFEDAATFRYDPR